jgi:hypothetical protein
VTLRLPPRDRRGRFTSPRNVAAAADRARARRRDRRSVVLHWIALVALPWATVLWLALGGRS